MNLNIHIFITLILYEYLNNIILQMLFVQWLLFDMRNIDYFGCICLFPCISSTIFHMCSMELSKEPEWFNEPFVVLLYRPSALRPVQLNLWDQHILLAGLTKYPDGDHNMWASYTLVSTCFSCSLCLPVVWCCEQTCFINWVFSSQDNNVQIYWLTWNKLNMCILNVFWHL